MLKNLFILISFLAWNRILCQEPSYSIVGENVLSGIDIYTIAQDKDGFIWLGTDNGIFKYDGYDFKKISNENLKGKSIFGLTKDNNGDLFAFNLSGQIIKIDNHSVSIFYEIPDSLKSSFYDIAFDEKNNLIIGGKSPFWVDKNQVPHLYFKSHPTSFLPSVKRLEKDLFFSIIDDTSFNLIKYNNGNQKKIIIPNSNSPIFIIQNKSNYTIFKNRDSFNYYEYNNNHLNYIDLNIKNDISKNIPYIAFLAEDSTLWQTTRKGGTIAQNKFKKSNYYNNIIFKDYFVSAFLEDIENNLWLTTLGKGIIFIPNKNILSFGNIQEVSSEIFTNIVQKGDKLFLSTLSGKIYEYSNNSFQLISIQNDTKIDLLKFYRDSSTLIFDGTHLPKIIDIHTKKTSHLQQMGSLKDVAQINDSIAVMATNYSIIFYNTLKNKITTSDYLIPKDIGRTSKVFYDKKTDNIWLSSLKGLMIFSKKINPVIYDSIFPTHFEPIHDKIFVATKDKGIIVFKEKNIVNYINTSNHLNSNSIYKIKYLKNHLFISHEKGIQLLNLDSKKSLQFDKTDGLFNHKINDFTFLQDKLWIATNDGIQVFDPFHAEKENYKPNILIQNIRINNSDTTINNPLVYHLNYTQNNINISFLSTTYQHKGKLTYAYKINELNTDWIFKNFYNNNIELTSLQSGSYTIMLKSINENNIESTPVVIQFIISPPFWDTWWFYSCIGFLFLAVTIFIYRYQLKKQQKKITLQNELNASKLIAIQSQMNPHFIFNSINSIQDLILQGDIDNSYSYIIKFSKLVRKTLDYSGKEFIDIEDEIELLEIYLELEKLRFKDDFVYNINTNNIDDIQVPPMLIQPFVENAIKHGLLHKEGIKRLTLTFVLEETLKCVIEDNGIGRKKAQEIKNRQQKTHKSFSVNATETRFNIMKSHYQQDLGMHYQDLYKEGEAVGTKVIIQIPINRNY